MNREKVIEWADKCTSPVHESEDCNECPYHLNHEGFYSCIECLLMDTVALLKEQEEWLRKFQKDKDKLCLEVSEWKHKFHDAPPKFVSQGVVDQICWERDTALSQLEQIGKGLGSKMDDIVALQKEQEAKQYNNHEVACILADLFGDPCACNFNDIDTWLPYKCDFRETCCPNPVGVACWEQYLKHKKGG